VLVTFPKLRKALLRVRRLMWRLLGLNIASHATVFEGVTIMNPKRVFMATRSAIGPGCCIKCVPGELHLGEHASLGEGCWVSSTKLVQIEPKVLIGPGCHITDANHGTAGLDPIKEQDRIAAAVTIGEAAWLGAGVKILAGVRVGRGAVVGAGAVVTKDVPDFAIVGGVPARVIGSRRDSEPDA
jgi:galactoside O-acetyltransferase